MTARELIRALAECEPDAEVIVARRLARQPDADSVAIGEQHTIHDVAVAQFGHQVAIIVERASLPRRVHG